MKLTAKIKLNPTEEQRQMLHETLQRANAACNYISDLAWQGKIFNKLSLQKMCYYDVRHKSNEKERSMRRSLLCLLALVLLVGFIPSALPRRAQAQNALPYLMYFDRRDTGPIFVIEQADGADSRLFAEGVMFEGSTYVTDGGWSASGEWFAWVGGTVADPLYFHQPYVLSADGSRQLQLPSGSIWARLLWHPSQDFLLLYTYSVGMDVFEFRERYLNGDSGLYDNAQHLLQVINASTGAVMRQIDLAETRPDLRLMGMGWRDDIGYLFFEPSNPNPEAVLRYVGIDTEGNLALNSSIFENPERPRPVPDISARGTYVEFDPGGMALIDPITDSSVGVELAEAAQSYRWNDEGTGLLAVAADRLYYVEASSGSATAISTLPDPEKRRFEVWWAAGGAYAYLRIGDEAFLLDSAAGTLVPMPLGGNADYIRARFWLNGQFIVSAYNYDEGFSTFTFLDPATQRISESSLDGQQVLYGDGESLSSDGRFLAVVGNDVRVLDLQNPERAPLVMPSDSRRYFAAGPGSANFHPSTDLFISRELALVAGGGSPMAYGVQRADGSLDRELGFCEGESAACAFWLPEQVDVSRLGAGLDRRPPMDALEQRIPLDDWYFAVALSSDVEWVAVGGQHSGNTPVHVFDLNSGQPVAGVPVYNYIYERLDFSAEKTLEITRREADLSGNVITLSTSPDGRRALVLDGQVRLIDTELGTALRVFSPYATWPNNGDFSPDGRLLAYNAALFEAETGERLVQLPYRYALGMRFSADGSRLAVTASTFVDVWDVAALLAVP